MTKEETAYAAALNQLGTGIVLSSVDDTALRMTLEDLRFAALASVMPAGPKVRCPYCPTPFIYGGPTDGEHFADLWEHLITKHHSDVRQAEDPAHRAWARPVHEFESAAVAA